MLDYVSYINGNFSDRRSQKKGNGPHYQSLIHETDDYMEPVARERPESGRTSVSYAYSNQHMMDRIRAFFRIRVQRRRLLDPRSTISEYLQPISNQDILLSDIQPTRLTT